MKLGDILSSRRIILDLQPGPKVEVLRELTARLAELGEIDDGPAVADALIEREEMITTGVKEGFAFPHAFTPHVDSLKLTIGVVRGGTDYQSLDARPVEFILLLLGPPSRQDLHLQVLARLSRIATESGMLEALREAETAEAILERFEESDRLRAAAP